MKNVVSLILVGVLVFAGEAAGYFVGPPVNLEKLAAEADVIFKATAVSSKEVRDNSFKSLPGYVPFETQFAIISLIKGSETNIVRFRHYDEIQQGLRGMYQPQLYHFQEKGSYLVFAKKTDAPDVCRQLWESHTIKEDLGVLRCVDDKPVASGTLKEIVRAELVKLLRSPQPTDRIYGIQQLDQMSERPDPFRSTKDFARSDVLELVGPLMTDANDETARAAITVIGSNNPYLTEERAQYWLATVGSAEVPGIGKMDPKLKNPGGERFRKELCAIADGGASVATRALAIRSLGLVRNAALVEPLSRWLRDPDPEIRASAVLLLADYPGNDALKQLTTLAADPAPGVRLHAARAIGFMQQAELAGTLGALLVDQDAKVRQAASLSLLSFSPKQETIAKIFVANLGNEEFSPLFLNALAGENPEAYLEPLAQAVERKTQPRNWSGGQNPTLTAFNILFKYLQSQPVDAVRDGKFDRCLDAIEKGYLTGSSEPRDIYAFYLQRGMTERAKAYRAAAKKAASYDLDYYFNMVDQSPATYTR